MQGKCRHEDSEDKPVGEQKFCFNFFKTCPGYENCEDYEESEEQMLSKKLVLEMLQKEIDWCKANFQGIEFEKGFIRGLRQAKLIIRKLSED